VGLEWLVAVKGHSEVRPQISESTDGRLGCRRFCTQFTRNKITIDNSDLLVSTIGIFRQRISNGGSTISEARP
jgi:hypothetical protein